MQNVDYSRKLKKDDRRLHSTEPKISLGKNSRSAGSGSILNLLNSNHQPLSFLYLFIGAILFFTSGLVIGMKIDQKESYFLGNESNTFRNVNSSDTALSVETPEQTNAREGKAELSDEDGFTNEVSTKKSTKTALPTIHKDLKFPPKLNQTNYIIQIGTFSREEANKWGASLIKDQQEFQGRLFRTSTGKLYLGYYYNVKDAKLVLKQIKKFRGGVFEEASIKNIQF
ncbi:MAG: SPOR domain-containing protein [Leptospiraceae bacterium]|nr:SPOR domain-containing protein [Leptospiraceae bacterium]